MTSVGKPCRRRVLRRALAPLAVVFALALPATAVAGQDDIYIGVLGHSGTWGPRHSITSVWVSWYSLTQACTQPWSAEEGWVGTSFCANSSDTNVGRSYCGCHVRQTFAWASGDWSDGYWRQFW